MASVFGVLQDGTRVPISCKQLHSPSTGYGYRATNEPVARPDGHYIQSESVTMLQQQEAIQAVAKKIGAVEIVMV